MPLNRSRGAQESPPPQGIYVPVPTFFAKEGSSNYDPISPPLDLETQSQHTLFLAKGGIQGLVILGSTGEAVFVRNEERKELIRSQRKALDDAGYDDRVIIAGTASQNIEDTIQLIEDSREAGAEYAMVLGPGYFAPATSQLGLQKWFEAVADRSALPILIYHYPGVTNNLQITTKTFENLAEHPKIVGTKLTHPMLDDATLVAASPRIDHDHFYVFTGLGQNLLPILTIGGAAAIDALAGCFPRVLVRLFRLYHDSSAKGTTKKDIETMRSLQFRICEGEKLVARFGVVGMKEALARVWNIGDRKGGRIPLAGGFEDGDQEWAKWDGLFAGLKEMEEQFKKEDETRRERERDPTLLQRGRTAYMYFASDERQRIGNDPGTKFGQLGKTLTERWEALSPEQKAPYEAKAAGDSERYEKEKAAYDAKQAME